jgi:hypothetical protein
MGGIPGRRLLSTLQASKLAVEGRALKLDLDGLWAKKEKERLSAQRGLR